MRILHGWKRRAAELVTGELYALYLACKEPRVPWYAKLLAVGVVAYALSPIDLIPDWIPILGYLDDLILVPLGIYLVLKMIPDDVMADCRERAKAMAAWKRPANRIVAAVIIVIWMITAALIAWFMIRVLSAIPDP